MPFAEPWNTAYEGVPPDTENINLGASRIRALKVDIRQRAGIDHSWGDANDNGQHNQVSFNVAAADPAASAVAGTGFLYTKTVSGNSELFYKDSLGNVTQVTKAGAVDIQSFPSGTVMSFLQATPPSGWNVNVTFNDAVIRLVNDVSGGTTGGSWTIGGTSLTLNRGTLAAATTTTDGGSTVTVAGHAISAAELPPHTHAVSAQDQITPATVVTGAGVTVQTGATSLITDAGPGTSTPHTHAGSTLGLILNSATNLSGIPAGTFSNDATWRPAYVNSCVGTKA